VLTKGVDFLIIVILVVALLIPDVDIGVFIAAVKVLSGRKLAAVVTLSGFVDVSALPVVVSEAVDMKGCLVVATVDTLVLDAGVVNRHIESFPGNWQLTGGA